MKSGAKSENSTVQKQTDALYNSYYSNYKLFSKIGITMNSDRTLSLDEDSFKKCFTEDSGRAGTVKRCLAVSVPLLIRQRTGQAESTAPPATGSLLPPRRQNTQAVPAAVPQVPKRAVLLPQRNFPKPQKTLHRQLPPAHCISHWRSWVP